jgi:cytokinin riboside 5'-monophosphate phosphoribohydrolase
MDNLRPVRHIRSLCVFCGSSTGARRAYTEAAAQLGHELAKSKISLVFGGGRVG